ncbi:MAG TPA: glycosyltransferase 87 family protein, partial [Candidatus Peribacteria bacterium]|nr:glycosyltransferase 87 family protein [Candidatus Peribacteria bacterium]
MPAHKHKNTRLPFADRSPVVPLLAAIGLLVWLGFLYKNNIAGVFDIGIYEGIGGRLKEILQGGTANIDSEYPPLATLLFFVAVANPLHVGFDLAWLVIVLCAIAAAGAYAVFALRDRLGWLIPASIAGTVFLIGPELVFARFDVLVAVMLLLSLRARATGHFAHCAAFLAVACAIKIVPALLIPAVFATAPRSEWKRMGLGFLAGLGASFLIPVAAMGMRLTMQNITHML